MAVPQRKQKKLPTPKSPIWLGITVKQDRLLTEKQERDKEQAKMG